MEFTFPDQTIMGVNTILLLIVSTVAACLWGVYRVFGPGNESNRTIKMLHKVVAKLQKDETEQVDSEELHSQITHLKETITRLQEDVENLENFVRETKEEVQEDQLSLVEGMRHIMHVVDIGRERCEKVGMMSLARGGGKPLADMEMQDFIDAVEDQHSGESIVKDGAFVVSKIFRDSAVCV